MKAIKASEFNPDDKGFIFHLSPLEAVLIRSLFCAMPTHIGKVSDTVMHMWAVMSNVGLNYPPQFMSISNTINPKFNLKEWVNENY